LYSSPYSSAALVTGVKLKSFERNTYRNLVVNHSLVSVVACTVQVEAVDINSVLWSFVDFVNCLGFEDGKTELQLVDGDLVLAGVGL
jgi:hypothetical protein